MPHPTPGQPARDALSDRNRKALEALRKLWAQPPARTDAEREAWVREIRIMREESTRRMLEKTARAGNRPVVPPAGDDPAPESCRP